MNGFHMASQVVLVVKNSPPNSGNIRDLGSTPELGWSPGGGHGNPLQYSCWGKFTDRGTWQATVHRTAKSQIWWKQLSICTHGLTANLLEYKSRFMLFQLYSILRICYLQDLVSYFSYVTYFTGSLPGSKALKRQASVQLLLGNQDIRVAESGRT